MRLIAGTALLGFAEMFDGAYGDPDTLKPYPRVTPSKVGPVLLPFPCPKCGKPLDVDGLKGYTARGFSWCPGCRGRFVLNREGSPLAETLAPGAIMAPAKVDGVVQGERALEVLGAI